MKDEEDGNWNVDTCSGIKNEEKGREEEERVRY